MSLYAIQSSLRVEELLRSVFDKKRTRESNDREFATSQLRHFPFVFDNRQFPITSLQLRRSEFLYLKLEN